MTVEIEVSGDGGAVTRRSNNEFQKHNMEDGKWAALEKLPTYDRVHTALLEEVLNMQRLPVDVRYLRKSQRERVIEKVLATNIEQDNERLLFHIKQRMDCVGIELPKVEVRFENLSVSADVYVGSRALPSLINFFRNILETLLASLHLLPTMKRDLPILHDLSGVIRPGRMTLLLGPPGGGKSTLLLALAGKISKDLKESGMITYNGHTMQEFIPQRTSAYIGQIDKHIGELTVRETLDFAARCQGVGYKYEMLTELARREKQLKIKPDPDIDAFMKAQAVQGKRHSLTTDYIMKLLGLDICADTLVGNDMIRGISGGQKKRVTTGEMIVGPKKTLFMDEISTGLDSSTTFQIVKCISNFVHLLEGTVLMALLQPASETFELFDDIVLLSEGQIVYLGPRENILSFFEKLGFLLPSRKGIADFLQEITSRKDQGQYWADKSKPYEFMPVTKMANAFKESEFGCEVSTYLATPYDRASCHNHALITSQYALSKWELLKACTEREWLLIRRNKFLYIFRTCQVGLVACITATLYSRTWLHSGDEVSGALYLSSLFFCLVHMMFNGFSEMSITIFRLPVFYNQRDSLFYPPWAFSIPSWILRIPYSMAESIIWSCIVYYSIGLTPEVGRFFRYMLLLFLMHQMAIGLFRLIGALGRSMVIANTFGSCAILIVFLLGGFVLAKDSIHPWWVWGFWLSPLSYALNAIAVNEFLAPRWNIVTLDEKEPLYVSILKGRGLFTEKHWYWVGVGILLGYLLLFNFLGTVALGFLEPIGKTQAVIPEDDLEEKLKNKSGGISSQNGTILPSLHIGNAPLHANSNTAVAGEVQLGHAAREMKKLEGAAQTSIDVADLHKQRGMILPFQPLALSFHSVCYYVDMPHEMKNKEMTNNRLQLLRNVSGAFRPGILTALVGVSGAGKTTLMDVLAGRKRGGYIKGEIRVSGFLKVQDTFARVSGYVEQTDIHSPQVTVHESLIYSSWLRLSRDVNAATRQKLVGYVRKLFTSIHGFQDRPLCRFNFNSHEGLDCTRYVLFIKFLFVWSYSIVVEEEKTFVEEVLELVELSTLRHALVGLPGSSGLSTEQRKRLTIAVELVANPSLIFMDEPTSGLDARAAAIVMRTIRNTVDTGRTVVCTIHQPSIDIFEAFDELLLMKRGGQVIYAGPLGQNSKSMVNYFQAIEGLPPIKLGYNPATWMLEVTTPATEIRLGENFADIYKSSTLYQSNEDLIAELSIPVPGAHDLDFPTQYSQSFWTQQVACLWKQNLTYWRSPYYNSVRFFFTFVCAVIFGSIFWGMGAKRATQQEVLNVMGALYAGTLLLGVQNASTVQPVVAVERAVFYREKAAGMYSALPYALAQGLIELPYIFVQTVGYAVITFSMIQYEWSAGKFFWYLLFLFLTFIYFTMYGMMAIGLTSTQMLAAIVSTAFYSLWNLFSGFLIPQSQMPIWWSWYYWIVPVQWTIDGLVSSQLGDVTTTIIAAGIGTISVKDYLQQYFGFRQDRMGFTAVILASFGCLFWLVFALSIKFLNFQRR